jgi:hypothetical protein
MGSSPDDHAGHRIEDPAIDTAPNPADGSAGRKRWNWRHEMSASTGTIRRPMGQGSIFAVIAIGVATLFAVGALAWGALSHTATRRAATSVATSAVLDRGSRDEGLRFDYGKPATATAATTGTGMPVYPDRGQRDEGLRFDFVKPATATSATTGTVTPVYPDRGQRDGGASLSTGKTPGTPTQVTEPRRVR